MADPGKRFEEDWRKSAVRAAGVSLDRLRDQEGGRMGIANICDFILYRQPHQYYFELKSTKGNSLPFAAVSDTQWSGLLEKSGIPGVFAGVLANYRELGLTYWLDIRTLQAMRDAGERKSVPTLWAVQHGLHLPGELVRTRYRYDLAALLDGIEERGNPNG